MTAFIGRREFITAARGGPTECHLFGSLPQDVWRDFKAQH
jgi:hypothetical protein